ncbi:MAG: molybdate ABC transporter substrate-binding protein [Alphaproteobacteria bacterium]|nr:molybdate ABC transporter substrate-binding protein [Alphaproteobacteria bacterium]
MRIGTGARHWLPLLGLALAIIASPAASPRAQPDIPVVAAASDLKFALEEIAGSFRRETGLDLKLTFGSSGNFARQIAQGAPFQLFLSADEAYVEALADQGRTVDRGAIYAVGRIVLFAPKGSPLTVDAGLAGLKTALDQDRIKRFAIANPEHAPYGRAAEQALRAQELWETIKPLLVLGENVSQAAQFALSGSAQGGIFAYSLALAPSVSGLGSFYILPPDAHAPLRQRMVLLKGAGRAAREFYAYLQGTPARAIFRRYGFLLPGETS